MGNVVKALQRCLAILRSEREKRTQKYFLKAHREHFAPHRRLMDFILLKEYESLVSEIERQADPILQDRLLDDLLALEAELAKRNLLDDGLKFD